MANLKNITELPVAESAEGLNLIVNDNGAAKQIAASAVGAQADFAVTDKNSPAFIKNKPEMVKSINGLKPTADGDVKIDTVTSWNDLKDKPFYTEENRTLVVEGIPDNEQGYYFNLNNQLEEGKEYTYVIDGIEYTGTAFWDDTDVNMVLYLNLGGDYSANIGLEYIRLNGFDTTVSHKIETLNVVVHKLDAKYLPSGYDAIIRYNIAWQAPELLFGSYNDIVAKSKNGEWINILIYASDKRYNTKIAQIHEIHTDYDEAYYVRITFYSFDDDEEKLCFIKESGDIS